VVLASSGKNSWDPLISMELTKIVEKLSVNSRCNNIYSKDGINAGGCFVSNREKLGTN
jgi:hypothetical protein